MKERKIKEMKSVLSQLILANGYVEEDERLSDSVSKESFALIRSPRNLLLSLQTQLEEIDQKTFNEARESERMDYLYEKTRKFMIESRQRFLKLQRHQALILSKYDEIKGIKAKSENDLQHAQAEMNILTQTVRRAAEKRMEKLDSLRNDKNEIEQEAAKIMKTLAMEMVRGQTSKSVAAAHAQELDAIYIKHVRSRENTRQDEQEREGLERALQTVCEVVNRSESLGLESKLKEVRLSDLIGIAHQFEMKMSSLESQVQSLSDWKHEVEHRCAEAQTELSQLRESQFQASELMVKIQGQMTGLGISHPADTYNQLKTYLEHIELSSVPEDVLSQEAFLASSFMTLNVVTRRLMGMLEYIIKQAGPLPGKLMDILHNLYLLQKHGDQRVEFGRLPTPTGSEEGDLQDLAVWDEVSTAPWFFREAYDDLPDWGLDLESIIKESCDILLVRIFCIDSRLKTDLRAWKAGQLDIVGESLHGLILMTVISFAHTYFRGKMGEAFGSAGTLVSAIAGVAAEMENEVNSVRLNETQLRQVIDFKEAQLTGIQPKVLTTSEKTVIEIIRKAFERKYNKLMAQQRQSFHLEEESYQLVTKTHTRKRQETSQELPASVSGTVENKRSEEEFTARIRKHAKSAAGQEKMMARTCPQGNRGLSMDLPAQILDVAEGFVQLRSINERIRDIRESEKPTRTARTQRQLPDIKPFTVSLRGTEGKTLKRVYSERQTLKKTSTSSSRMPSLRM